MVFAILEGIRDRTFNQKTLNNANRLLTAIFGVDLDRMIYLRTLLKLNHPIYSLN